MNDATATPDVELAPPGGHEGGLTGQQRSVVEELTRLDGELARMYLGATQALHQDGNPERFAQAAHSLRELLDWMGDRLGGPIAGGPDLHKEVCDLRAEWPDDGIPSVFGDRWDSPEPDNSLRGFLNAAKAFFARFDSRPPNRREQTGRLFVTTDPHQRRLSPPIEEVHVTRWLDVRRELLAVAHHGRNPTPSEFQQVFDRVDSLLIERLRPTVFEQQDEIDQIVAEGESNA
jgi:hypothetical protein